MHLSTIKHNPPGLDQLIKIPKPTNENVSACADTLLEIVNNFPALKMDVKSSQKLNTLVDNIFSIKDHLTEEKQKAISNLFYDVHELNPTRYTDLICCETSAKKWIGEHPEAKAIVEGKQEYPIAGSLLKEEDMPCNQFFKSMTVQLNDQSVIEISQGLLAHFSKSIREILKDKPLDKDLAIILPQLNHHQFDVLIALLEVEQPGLINDENYLTLLYAAEELQIPEVINACKKFIQKNYKQLDLKTLVELHNHFEPNEPLSKSLGLGISLFIKNGLSKKDLSDEFKGNLSYLKEHLKHPITISLGKLDIENSALNLLKGLPIDKLHLMQCKNLTSDCMSIIADMKSIIALDLGGNDWVDDNALGLISKQIEELSLTGCRKFSGKGLASLQDSGIIKFELNHATHLTDDDYASLPTQFQSIDLRSCKGIGNKAMHRLGQMGNLHHLVLSNTSVTSADIQKLPLQLQTLDLTGSATDNNASMHLGRMNDLKELMLGGAIIDNHGINSLPGSLTHLKLDDCQNVSDEGIASLTKRNQFQSLAIRRCPQISYEMIKNIPSSDKVNWEDPPLSTALASKSRK